EVARGRGGQVYRQKKPAVRPNGRGIGHVLVDGGECCVEARRIEPLQPLDLRTELSLQAPLGGTAAREVAGRDVGVLRDFADLRERGRLTQHEAGAYARCDQLRERAHVQNSMRRERIERRLVLAAVAQQSVRRVFQQQKVVLLRQIDQAPTLARRASGPRRILEVRNHVKEL